MSGPYQQPGSAGWFLRRSGYVLFMLRELTAVFLGIYLIFLLLFLCRLGSGEEQFLTLLVYLNRPLCMVFHAMVLLAATWHAITWFNLTPKAMPLFLGSKRLADPLVAIAMGYLPWLVMTAVILWAVCP